MSFGNLSGLQEQRVHNLGCRDREFRRWPELATRNGESKLEFTELRATGIDGNDRDSRQRLGNQLNQKSHKGGQRRGSES